MFNVYSSATAQAGGIYMFKSALPCWLEAFKYLNSLTVLKVVRLCDLTTHRQTQLFIIKDCDNADPLLTTHRSSCPPRPWLRPSDSICAGWRCVVYILVDILRVVSQFAIFREMDMKYWKTVWRKSRTTSHDLAELKHSLHMNDKSIRKTKNI